MLDIFKMMKLIMKTYKIGKSIGFLLKKMKIKMGKFNERINNSTWK